MFTSKRSVADGKNLNRVRLAVTAAAILLWQAGTLTASEGQKIFSSPADAASELVQAAKDDDLNALGSILGPGAKEILSSGDPVADDNARNRFVALYNEMHRLAYDDDGRVIMYLGAENWPFPIPLVKNHDGWMFDTSSGEEELLHRRIGSNELYTIDVLEDLVSAQKEYAAEARDGSANQFAQKIVSDPGKRNGLYWPASKEEPQSPIGPLIAEATEQGYKTDNAAPIPFHGYYYKILTRQGKNAPGGARDYLVDGRMERGFAFLAFPAGYRSSGVMTFMVNQDGLIVQKDLGANTAAIAQGMVEFNPDKTWDEVLE